MKTSMFKEKFNPRCLHGCFHLNNNQQITSNIIFTLKVYLPQTKCCFSKRVLSFYLLSKFKICFTLHFTYFLLLQAELYRVQKAFDKAEPLYLEAIDILEEAFGPEDVRYVMYFINCKSNLLRGTLKLFFYLFVSLFVSWPSISH